MNLVLFKRFGPLLLLWFACQTHNRGIVEIVMFSFLLPGSTRSRAVAGVAFQCVCHNIGTTTGLYGNKEGRLAQFFGGTKTVFSTQFLSGTQKFGR